MKVYADISNPSSCQWAATGKCWEETIVATSKFW